MIPNVAIAMPELVLAISAMALLLLGVFRGEGSARLIAWLSCAVLLAVAVLVLTHDLGRSEAFGGAFVVDPFSRIMKLLVLGGGVLATLLALGHANEDALARPEFPVLVLLASLGMMLMVSANDLIALYTGLELQSLALYVLAAFRRDTVRSSEAGLKYFLLGALSSGLLLYGASLVYGFAGSTQFDRLAEVLGAGAAPTGAVIGMVFVAAGIAFKLSAVPFHMWTPDVYEGSPTAVTALFAMAPKVAAMALFIRVLTGPFHALTGQWQQIVVAMSVLSMLLGSFAAIAQTNIKRLLAYSSIGHVGYALVGIASGTQLGIQATIVYMAIYIAMSGGSFAVLLSMRQRGQPLESMGDLAGLGRTRPATAAAMAIFMFSMIGIPPLAGFWGKLYVVLAAIDAGMVELAVIAVLTSVVGAYYYLRVVKLLYFDEAAQAFDAKASREVSIVMGLSAAFTLLFIVAPAALMDGAGEAAAALFR